MRAGVEDLRGTAGAAARRFPPALSCSAIAAAAFGFPLFFSLKMFAERKRWNPVALNVARAAFALLAAACSFTLPEEPTAPAVVRFSLLCVGFFPLVRKLRSEFKDDGKATPVRVPREKLEIVGTEMEGTVRVGNVQGEVPVKTAP